uniref:Uncharacterized protein n=2 Tax=Sphaerodactylus townsendi TaxID=933632 RepID=A0ACB8F4W7_9SAUR
MPERVSIKKSTADSKDNGLKEKKSFIPLSIEDEIEKPNAKIIRVDLPKEKAPTSMKMSETQPVLCNNEVYLQKFILDKIANQPGDKASVRDTCVVFTQLNPILQNNYNETLAIHQGQHFASRVIAKKRMPTSFLQSNTFSAEILSSKKMCYNPMHSQTEKPAEHKMPAHFNNANVPFMKEDVKERNASQLIHKDEKCEFVVCGVNIKTDIYHEIVSDSGFSTGKSEVLDSYHNYITPIEEAPKKRIVFVDYVPISKPVKIHTFGEEPIGLDSSLSVSNYSEIHDCTKSKAIKKDRSDVNQDASDKKVFLDKNSLDNMEFSRYCHQFSFEEDSEISSTTISTESSRSFNAEVNASQVGEKQPITFSLPRVISIPTAQCDASEYNRDLPMQKTNGH